MCLPVLTLGKHAEISSDSDAPRHPHTNPQCTVYSLEKEYSHPTKTIKSKRLPDFAPPPPPPPPPP